MSEEKTEKPVKFRVSTNLYDYEKEYLQRLADENGRSMSNQLRFILRETYVDDDD